jgi:hypothetical protein
LRFFPFPIHWILEQTTGQPSSPTPHRTRIYQAASTANQQPTPASSHFPFTGAIGPTHHSRTPPAASAHHSRTSLLHHLLVPPFPAHLFEDIAPALPSSGLLITPLESEIGIPCDLHFEVSLLSATTDVTTSAPIAMLVLTTSSKLAPSLQDPPSTAVTTSPSQFPFPLPHSLDIGANHRPTISPYSPPLTHPT